MEIRKADIADLKQIIDLNKIVDYHNPDKFIEESINHSRVLVAIDYHNIIIGFLLYQELWGNTIFLSLLKIHSDFYKQGIGTKLLEAFEFFLKKKGITHYISSTMQNNEGAQIFHQKSGFDVIGLVNMSYGDELFYKKDI